MTREGIPQFKTLEEEKAYWESKGPLGIEAQREEIREGVARWLVEYFKYGWDELSEDKQNQKLDEAQSLMSHLHDKGVVIKVDRDLPTQRWDEFIEHNWVDLSPMETNAMKGLVKTGYEAIESLI